MNSNRPIMLSRIAFLILIAISSCNSSNILAVIPVASKSHHYMFQPIIKELGFRGHNITFISPYQIETNTTNINQIIVHTSAEKMIHSLDFNVLLEMGSSPIFFPPEMSFWFYGQRICKEYLNNSEIQRLIHSKDTKFDLILLETSFGQESLMGFSYKFNAPVISLNSFVNYIFLDEFVGNPLDLSYVPHLELPFSNVMNLFERLKNFIRSTVILIYGYYVYLPEQEALMKKYFNYTDSENIPPLVDMLKNNISLSIVNSHLSIDYARPLVPNVICAAGIHITKNSKPLTKDIQDFMDNSKNGVIYFSFGTIIPSHRMPAEFKNNFIKAFGKLKQNVLWKANVDSMADIPDNVKVAKWLSQQSVLAHPNCIAFITHGGLLSQQEAIYYGIPLLTVPIFADQHQNAARAAVKGFAINLNRKNLTESSLLWAINEIVYNNKNTIFWLCETDTQ
ncbi:UDP-glycosyltransferase UGT4-like isoform X2 [Lycorma delicatula]|uniref:UDP-glycosyltransferase UGT4-like isoform X2 n=1 Tax=Lycorma delicatula TaxID=130591 RepID=UPI003F5134D2